MSRLGAFLLLVLAVGGFAVYVLQAQPVWYERLRYPLRYEAIVTAHAENYSLDPDLLAAVIYQESKFDASARSSSGAVGLMQLLPGTAKGIALRTGGHAFEVDDLLDKYGEEEAALAAYNAGQANVDQWRAAGKGIAFAETRHYVRRVERIRLIYARAYASELGLAAG